MPTIWGGINEEKWEHSDDHNSKVSSRYPSYEVISPMIYLKESREDNSKRRTTYSRKHRANMTAKYL